MTTPTFDTQASVSKLRSAGIDEPAAHSIVEVVSDATSPLVTRDMLRADMYRALDTGCGCRGGGRRDRRHRPIPGLNQGPNGARLRHRRADPRKR